MRYDPRHPERAPVPDCTVLGADPEPLGTERFAALTRAPRTKVAPRPRTCPLAAAFGKQAPCTGGACLFFSVPGVPSVCAVDHWSPEARSDRALAAWYVARRDEAAGGVRRDDPVVIPLHTLATAGPGDS
jgi:hypothetical protein